MLFVLCVVFCTMIVTPLFLVLVALLARVSKRIVQRIRKLVLLLSWSDQARVALNEALKGKTRTKNTIGDVEVDFQKNVANVAEMDCTGKVIAAAAYKYDEPSFFEDVYRMAWKAKHFVFIWQPILNIPLLIVAIFLTFMTTNFSCRAAKNFVDRELFDPRIVKSVIIDISNDSRLVDSALTPRATQNHWTLIASHLAKRGFPYTLELISVEPLARTQQIEYNVLGECFGRALMFTFHVPITKDAEYSMQNST